MIKMIENKSWRGYGTARISYTASDCENQHSHFGKINVCQYLVNLNIYMLYEPEILFLDIYSTVY